MATTTLFEHSTPELFKTDFHAGAIDAELEGSVDFGWGETGFPQPGDPVSIAQLAQRLRRCARRHMVWRSALRLPQTGKVTTPNH